MAFTEAEFHAAAVAGKWRPTTWNPLSQTTLDFYVANTQALATTPRTSASGTRHGLTQAAGQQALAPPSTATSAAAPLAHDSANSAAQEEATSGQGDPTAEAEVQASAASQWLNVHNPQAGC